MNRFVCRAMHGCGFGLRGAAAFAAGAILLLGSAGRAEEGDQAAKPTRLFDGKSLAGWKVLDELDFKGHGRVEAKDGRIALEKGDPFTGLQWKGKFPRTDYEVSLEAMRVAGDDFFCGLVFPVGKADLSLVVGGWGGTTVGLSNIDGEPAVENETSQSRDFEKGRWYTIRLRVTAEKVQVWIDNERLIDFRHADRRLTIRWEQEAMRPFGVCTWRTSGAIRNVTLHELRGQDKTSDIKP